MFQGLDQTITQAHFAKAIIDLINRLAPPRQKIDPTTGTTKRIQVDDIGDFLGGLVDLFRAHFQSHKHPAPTLNVYWPTADDKGTCALFDPTLWQVYVNPRLVGLEDGLSRLGAIVLARSLYHEMRHAEQYCITIRYVWTTHAGANTDHLVKRSLTNAQGMAPPFNVVYLLKFVPLKPGKNISLADYELAARFFQSLYRTSAISYVKPASIGGPIERIEADETIAANTELRNARTYADQVHEEIVTWNAAKPTRFFFRAVEVDFLQGNALMRYRSRPIDDDCLDVMYHYLVERRERAFRRQDIAYRDYRSVPVEFDAHNVEGDFSFASKLSDRKMAKKVTEAGVVKADFLPEPVRWS